MIFEHTVIDNFAYELPPETVSSEEIEASLEPLYRRLRLPAGRLELMSGIKERSFWPRGCPPSHGATLAGHRALERASVPASAIGCLINCSVSRDFLEPATAAIVHEQLGLPRECLVFDLSNACLGMLSGMLVLGSMIDSGMIGAGLLVSGENARPLLESTIAAMLNDSAMTRQSVKPFFASLTIGSGSAAILMAHRRLCPDGHRLICASSRAESAFNHLCRGNADKGMNDHSDTIMNTDSEALLHAGVDAAYSTWQQFRQESRLTSGAWDCICTHQVGIAHKRLLFERLGLDPLKDFSNLEMMGNVGSVSCPLAVAMAGEAGRLRSGDKLAMLGIGSGINCTMLGVEW